MDKIVELRNGWYYDKNDNCWNSNIFTEDQAIKNSKLLIKCRGCRDSSGCINRRCSDCSGCIDCRYCSDFKTNPERVKLLLLLDQRGHKLRYILTTKKLR